MDQPIGIRLPKEMLKKLSELSKRNNEDRSTVIRKLVLIGYMEALKQKSAEDYIQGKITLSEAASRSDISLWEMERYLIEKGFKSEYSLEDLEKEINLLNT